ncbi:MAG: ABC transporter permease [Bacteroidales bacterium]|nr:ABC transporter permease [Bacteroidales bacterium]
MYKDLFRHSLRALSRQKSYVLINILGLATGIACSLIIALFVIHELSYDEYHVKKDRIFRIILNGKISGQEIRVTSTCAPLGPTMKAEFPEVENFLRINNWGETIIRSEEKFFTEEHFMEADSGFFDFFSIPLIRGSKENVLNQKHTVVLSETTARKIFGDADPVNKMLKVGNDSSLYRVTGIFADIPETTHFDANMIGSFMTNPRAGDEEWLSNSFSTYILLKPNASAASVDAKFSGLIVKYVGPLVTKYLGLSLKDFLAQGNKYRMFLQPLSSVHLDPTIQQDLKPASDPKYLWIFGSIALLIILIAAINFMNLSTAQASRRAKEIGIKKVSGSSRGNLISQFITETVLLSFISLLVAIMITELTLPTFNKLLDIKLNIGYFTQWYTIPSLLVLTLAVGFLAGSYPAFYMSSFNPYVVLKGKLRSSRASVNLRSALVVLQFSISIVLIVGTLIMFRQISFMLKKDLGFNKENVLVIRRADAIGNHIADFKAALLRIPGVLKVAASTAVPNHSNNNNGYMIKDRPDETFLMQTNWVDYDYLETYGLKLESGRFFDKKNSTDVNACIINQEAVKDFNLIRPFETRIIRGGNDDNERTLVPVIGVVRDFHFESLHSEIVPHVMMFKNEDNQWGYFSVRLAPSVGKATLSEIEKTWGSFTSNDPMQFFFMDKDVEQMYRAEKQNASLSIVFTIMAILIASLGLYGLTAFTVQQRTREIGIRKTFGASVSKIWFLIAREIIVLIIISMAIAVPLVYLVADNFLNNYHYRVSIGAGDFVSGFVIAVVIAMATISYRSIRVALINPADSLRYE